MKCLARLFLCFFLFPVVVCAGEIPLPKTYTLKNGLTLAVIEKPGLPVVTHMVWYRTGGRDDPWGRSGVAHFLEHMMFRGTRNIADGEFSRRVSALGGNDNAFTSWDFTAYFQNVPASALAEVMGMEADRMANLRLDEAAFAREKNVILEERAMRTGNNPQAILYEEASAAFYRNAPYMRPVIGWEEEIRNISLQDLKSFYEAFYAPQNALVIVAGGVAAGDVLKLAKKTYGAVKPRKALALPLKNEPPHSAGTVVKLVHQNVRQPSLALWWPAPSYGTEPDVVAPLDMLVEYLGAPGTGALYREFVIMRRRAENISVSTNSLRQGTGVVSIDAVPVPGVKPEELAQEIRSYILQMTLETVPAAEWETLKTRLKADAIYLQDSLSAGAYVFGQAFTIGLPFAAVADWPAAIDAVTPEAVTAMQNRIFTGVAQLNILEAPQ